MTMLQSFLRDHYGRDRSGHILVPQRDAELIAKRLDELEALLREAREDMISGLIHNGWSKYEAEKCYFAQRIAAALEKK
jgi:hypothetical protein